MFAKKRRRKYELHERNHGNVKAAKRRKIKICLLLH